ncbi:cytosolic endo-beta-N-acetylglucosaminidase-like [Uloborus diversus]|uniref:cytosolic endo-beta-N-acetylglucosaminidase-like n=1 Tax=Uloborus diversus TaxID=327109 RepID=UPI002409F393|nr:cytosolic endo-beta-N-acetylglucosaminidase-like [Uloborus diversus]
MEREDTLNCDQNLEFILKKEECLPISSYEELKEWTPSLQKHFTESLLERVKEKNRPKTLVCHDMKGGYLEDRFLNGSKEDNNYYFIHWSFVDIFVYFSHHFVTIPPCTWITAAHRNGVKILGTFITEWNDGATTCESMLADDASVQELCRILVKIASHYKFDGWLINIENKIQANQVSALESFVQSLTQMMHDAIPHSLVIWYDSVLNTGELKWQNELNEHNRNFFLVCDGIFLNYGWKEENLSKSISEAADRVTDIYVGIDVFGRGCFGGGGFSTDIAAAVARKFGLSIAIFAPGWVYETLDRENFKENQYKFWSTLSELCPVKKFLKLPYYSSFCPGFGKKMFRNGKIISTEPWFNLSLQQCQPTFHYTHYTPKTGVISLYEEDAFNGGCCLNLSGVANSEGESLCFQILSSHFVLETSVVLSFVFKTLSDDIDVSLMLNIHSGAVKDKLFLLRGNAECADYSGRKLLPTWQTKLLNSNFRLKPCDPSWTRRVYLLELEMFKECVIEGLSVYVRCLKPSADYPISVLVGEIEVLPFLKALDFQCKNVSCTNENNMTFVSCTLEWTENPSLYCSDIYITQNGKTNFLCTTNQFCYNFKQSFCSSLQYIDFELHPHSNGNEHFEPVTSRLTLTS